MRFTRFSGDEGLDALRRFVERHPRLFVLTGAGVSTECGIPDYRDREGRWKRRRPVLYGDFVRDEGVRRRYWARSLPGWRRFAAAGPGRAHRALAALESAGTVHRLVTQNVDGLHQRAGSRRVIDLHGRLDSVECLTCASVRSRSDVQQWLEAANPAFEGLDARAAPDGDADLDGVAFERFRIPTCACGGTLKPSVVFFGESVPRARVARAMAALADSDAVLVVGSSLMVYSGYRFCVAAARAGKPVAAINLGRTRADGELTVKVRRDCGEVLAALTAPARPGRNVRRAGRGPDRDRPATKSPASTRP